MPESMRLFVSEADRQESPKRLRASNTTAKPFVWTKSAESILAAVDRAKRSIATNQTRH